MKEQNRKVLLTGGTGFIGTHLCSKLKDLGFEITVLTRKTNLVDADFLKAQKTKITYINNLDEIDFDFDVVINLSGAPISVRWSESAMREIYSSRIDVTRKIVQKINSAKRKPNVFISGSAIGYYGTSESLIFHEKSQPTNQNLFSQNICIDWENEAKKIDDKVRLVILRTGVVIGRGGGMIKKLILPFGFGLGGKIGSGKQYLSWIHIEDAVLAIIHLIDSSLSGPINLTSPQSVTNSEFTDAFAAALMRPAFFNMPSFVLKKLYGKMAEELLLNGQRVYPRNLIDNGFVFKFEDIGEALK